MKRLLSLSAVAFFLFACGRSPLVVVDDYIKAHNNDNVEAVLALCSPNVSYTLEGMWERQGKDPMRALMQWDAALHSRLSVRDRTGEGDLVRTLMVATNDWLQLVKIDSLTYVSCFQVSGGKIIGIHNVLTGPSELELKERQKEIIDWAKKAFPSDMDFVMPSGTWSYTADSARKWMAISTAWMEQQAGIGS